VKAVVATLLENSLTGAGGVPCPRGRWQNIKRADWTQLVKPFWPAVLLSSLRLKSLKVLAKSTTVRKGALAILVGGWGDP
jgi:hypothetical protein